MFPGKINVSKLPQEIMEISILKHSMWEFSDHFKVDE